MGSGISVEASLPERLDEAQCRELAGEAFDAALFAAHADVDGLFVTREKVLAHLAGRDAEKDESWASQAEVPHSVAKTAMEESDDEFEREMQSVARTTRKLRVHLFARNSERGSLGGERAGATKTPSAAATLLPPSTVHSGQSHRLQPVPLTIEVCGRMRGRCELPPMIIQG